MDSFRDIRFDIAISFAGEDREVASAIASELDKKGFRVFYDEFFQHELWGKDLTTYLADVFSKFSRYCLILVSKEYVDKVWSIFELKQALSKQIHQNEYILLLRLDNTPLEGYPATYAYINYKSTNTVVDLIEKKLQEEDVVTNRIISRTNLNKLAREYLFQKGVIENRRRDYGPSDQADDTSELDKLDQLLQQYRDEMNKYRKKYMEHYDPLSAVSS